LRYPILARNSEVLLRGGAYAYGDAHQLRINNSWQRSKFQGTLPQRLKPHSYQATSGTAEAVPFQNRILTTAC